MIEEQLRCIAPTDAERLVAYAEAAPVPMVFADGNGQVRSCNRHWEQLVGLASERALGDGWLEAIAPDDRTRAAAEWATACAAARPLVTEWHLRRADGESGWVQCWGQPRRDQHGAPTGFSAVLTDITRRKRAELDLARSEAAYRLLFDEGPLPMWVVRQGDQRLLVVNRAAVRHYGWSRDEFLAMTTRDLCADPSPSTESDEHPPTPVQHRRKDGAVIEVELHTQGMLFDRRPADVIVAVDVSERQHAERELRRRSQDLARSNADLEQFASVAAHDLQEPLRMIDGHLHVILNNHSQGLAPRARQHLAFVVDAAARLRDMVRGVLVYARVPAHAAAFAPVDSAAAAWEALGFLRHAVDQSGASVSIVDLPKVNADFNQLRQLFQNLIGNAIKFAGGARPEVALRAEPWTDGCWRFTVSDQGIGIPAHQRERVFGLFQRLDNQVDGCGIGLATCRRIVERHGGRIWLEDADHGTTVTFTLPGPTVVAKPARAAESGGDYRA